MVATGRTMINAGIAYLLPAGSPATRRVVAWRTAC